jgi:hypothetical protein
VFSFIFFQYARQQHEFYRITVGFIAAATFSGWICSFERRNIFKRALCSDTNTGHTFNFFSNNNHNVPKIQDARFQHHHFTFFTKNKITDEPSNQITRFLVGESSQKSFTTMSTSRQLNKASGDVDTNIKRTSTGIHTVEGNVAGARAARLTKQRESDSAAYELKKKKLQDDIKKGARNMDDRFNTASLEFKGQAIGLMSKEEFAMKSALELQPSEEELAAAKVNWKLIFSLFFFFFFFLINVYIKNTHNDIIVVLVCTMKH